VFTGRRKTALLAKKGKYMKMKHIETKVTETKLIINKLGLQ